MLDFQSGLTEPDQPYRVKKTDKNHTLGIITGHLHLEIHYQVSCSKKRLPYREIIQDPGQLSQWKNPLL